MLKILIVDDSAEDRALVERVLHQCKVLNPVHSIKSGLECITVLEKALSCPKGQKPDRFLVLLDLVMSPHSGHWVLREAAHRNITDIALFVMLSGIVGIKDVHEGYQLGAKTFLVKPIKPEDVLELFNCFKKKIRVQEYPTGYMLEWISEETAPSTNAIISGSRLYDSGGVSPRPGNN